MATTVRHLGLHAYHHGVRTDNVLALVEQRIHRYEKYRECAPRLNIAAYLVGDELRGQLSGTSRGLADHPASVARLYASRTPRPHYNSEHLTELSLARWGRGVSFHELEIAIGLDQIELLESMHQYLARIFPWYLDQYEKPVDQRYRALLGEIAPELAAQFTEETLNLALRKR